MDWMLYILVKGGEVNDKTKFLALFRDKARRSAKLGMLIWLHAHYNPLRFQVRYRILCLGFDIEWNWSGFEGIQ